MIASEIRNNEERFRIDVTTHDLLMGGARRVSLAPAAEPLTLPEPVFPRFPEKLNDVEPDPRYVPQEGDPYRTRVTAAMVRRGLRGWLYPYIRSRVMPGQFHPIIAYLFTEWKCNLDCHYCWAFDNSVKGMTEDVARRSIDWLHDTGCRVLALMGGEVLLRPQFAHKVVSYAARKGFWVYLPTNGRLMRKEVIDRLGDAGVAVVNLAVDSVELRKELPKALVPIRSYFDYLIKKQYVYGFSVFFNINITRINLDDVKQLTEIAHDNGIATDYHINESPMLEQSHFKHQDGNSTFITKEDWPKVDALVDWLIEKNQSGYKMVNSVRRLQEMKAFMKGKLQDWDCRAGQNNVIIRTDGTLAPCFPMYSATYDWGVVGDHKFETGQLNEMKQACQPHCFSTLNHNLAYCYKASRAIKWTLKQAFRGFQGTTGSFEE
ncbi:MAG TPA: radical SAM protein [Bryobacteraceae bacterium]|nr:radical SAM protein [Bryobacteraceae bacterium]